MDIREDYILREKKRKRKKRMIIFIPLIFIFLIVVIFFFISFKEDPSCFDNKLNGNEEGIDCGGDCIACGIKYAAPLEILSYDIFSSSEGFSQLLFRMRNNNFNYGATFKYGILLKNDLGEELDYLEGDNFIHHSSNKYFVEPKLRLTKEEIASIDIKILETDWFLDEKKAEDLFSVSEANLILLNGSDEEGYLEARGKISNETLKNFSKIDLVLIIYSKTGKMINSAKTSIFNVGSSDIIDVNFIWLDYFSELRQIDLNRVDIFPDALF